MFRKIALGAGAIALLLPASTLAHHPTGSSSTSGAGPISTISATTLEQGQSAAGVFFEMVKVRAFSDGQLIDFAGKHIHAHSLDAILAPSLVYAYGLTKDLTLSARLPYIIRQDIREGSHHHPGHGAPAINSVVELGDSEGIGDLTLLAQYRFFNNQRSQTEAALLLGLKAPTGRTNVNSAEGTRFETEFQPGTGSWDGLFGLAFTQRFGLWSFDTSVLYQLATTGAQETDLGDRFLYNAAISYRMFGGGRRLRAHECRRTDAGADVPRRAQGQRAHHHHEEPAAPRGPALDLVLELNGEWHDHQVIDGVRDPNSGGNVVYLSPGVRFSMDKWSAFASVGFPVVNQMYGVQAEPDWRLLTGIAVNF